MSSTFHVQRYWLARPMVAATSLGLLMAGCAPSETAIQTPPVDTNTTASEAMTDDTMMTNAYADGTYMAMGNYTSPAGVEEVDVTLMLENDVIVGAEFGGKAEHPTSMKMQGNFAAGYEQEVVGMSVDDVSLTVVNGSSLTPKGFMDALMKIKAEAQA